MPIIGNVGGGGMASPVRVKSFANIASGANVSYAVPAGRIAHLMAVGGAQMDVYIDNNVGAKLGPFVHNTISNPRAMGFTIGPAEIIYVRNDDPGNGWVGFVGYTLLG